MGKRLSKRAHDPAFVSRLALLALLAGLLVGGCVGSGSHPAQYDESYPEHGGNVSDGGGGAM